MVSGFPSPLVPSPQSRTLVPCPLSLSPSLQQIQPLDDGAPQALGIRRAGPRDVEGRAVVRRRAEEGQAQGAVHGVALAHHLGGDHALVVVERDGDGVGVAGPQEEAVRRDGPFHLDALGDEGLDGGLDDLALLAAQKAPLTRVGVEARHAETGAGVELAVPGLRQAPDEGLEGLAGDGRGDVLEGQVRGEERHGHGPREEDHVGLHGEHLAQVLGVPREGDAAAADGLFGHGARDQQVRLLALHAAAGLLEGQEGHAPVVRMGPPVEPQVGEVHVLPADPLGNGRHGPHGPHDGDFRHLLDVPGLEDGPQDLGADPAGIAHRHHHSWTAHASRSLKMYLMQCL